MAFRSVVRTGVKSATKAAKEVVKDAAKDATKELMTNYVRGRFTSSPTYIRTPSPVYSTGDISYSPSPIYLSRPATPIVPQQFPTNCLCNISSASLQENGRAVVRCTSCGQIPHVQNTSNRVLDTSINVNNNVMSIRSLEGGRRARLLKHTRKTYRYKQKRVKRRSTLHRK